MTYLKGTVSRFMQDESGQNLIEYALIACIVGLAAITSMDKVATSLQTAFNSISTKLNKAN